jgi:hypothetical protein
MRHAVVCSRGPPADDDFDDLHPTTIRRTAMRRIWKLRSVGTKLAAVLAMMCLVVAMAAQAGASQEADRGAQAAPESVAGWPIYFAMECSMSSTTVTAQMVVQSTQTGTGYVNIYKRKSTGNVLVAHVTKSGQDFRLYAYEPRQAGYGYFATAGFNASSFSRSAGDNC